MIDLIDITVIINGMTYIPTSREDWRDLTGVAMQKYDLKDLMEKIKPLAVKDATANMEAIVTQLMSEPDPEPTPKPASKSKPAKSKKSASGDTSFDYVQRILKMAGRAMTVREIMNAMIAVGWKSDSAKPIATVRRSLNFYKNQFVRVDDKWQLVEWGGAPPKG